MASKKKKEKKETFAPPVAPGTGTSRSDIAVFPHKLGGIKRRPYPKTKEDEFKKKKS